MSHRTRAVHPRAVTCALACVTAAGAGLAGAAPASAASSWEQISRGNGAQGATYFSNQNVPVFASDTGTFGVVQPVPFLRWFRHGNPAPTNIRSVVENTTRTIAHPRLQDVFFVRERPMRFTADEKTLLVGTSAVHVNDGDLPYALRPIAGGPDLPVTGGDYFDEGENDATVSGDGSTVAVDDRGVKVVDVATGVATHFNLESGAFTFGNNGISDNGTVIAGSSAYSDGGFYVSDGILKSTAGPTQVSPDGTKVFTLVRGNPDAWESDRLDVLRLSDGSKRSHALPTYESNDFLWISADGSRVAVTPNGAGEESDATATSATTDPPTRQSWVLNTASGKWAKFGRQFSTSLNDGSKVSRNGRYAVVEYDVRRTSDRDVRVSQAALVDLSGGDLPGDQEPLSASSYLHVTPPISWCGSGGGTMRASFGRPAPWAPLPRKGELTITIDGREAIHTRFSASPAEVTAPFRATDQSVTTKVTVVDHVGRTLTTQQTIPVRCAQDEP